MIAQQELQKIMMTTCIEHPKDPVCQQELEHIAACGLDPAFYANRHREFDEVFPWDHLDYGVKKEFFIEECKRAYAAQTTPNCREQCSHCGAACYKGGICVEKRENMV